ncbi:hypothetical protein GQ54DRAFT_216977 [Martensiomyces pterosporus]|nr:hypothetical protein GQ54DRAFT_216977 [Martensiomyces pterosporus]
MPAAASPCPITRVPDQANHASHVFGSTSTGKASTAPLLFTCVAQLPVACYLALLTLLCRRSNPVWLLDIARRFSLDSGDATHLSQKGCTT